ncbi:DUF2948 family protein [Xinfangfangia sp. D13-10-4-6]|uniref:DUF2948 family protein n=1 Tax=Pseudogemmobacter hezensis TaxID=2737662 RepID=UPI001554FC43|nr:DUF2948 family protein [Pseudogemmobacter hezensis]NPD16457.1 DUF2948 family protein [Pseudogemmobacter hezensis]
MADARFEDGDEGPLNLLGQSPEDLTVMASLLQDAVLPASEMKYDRKRRRFAALVNRFRWEDAQAAERAGRPFERVRSLLTVDDVLEVRSQGITPGDADQVLSLLDLTWIAGEDGTGRLQLILAGDGVIELAVEVMDITLRDVTKPYLAPSRKKPDHGDGAGA